jgi:hypothetical protein
VSHLGDPGSNLSQAWLLQLFIALLRPTRYTVPCTSDKSVLGDSYQSDGVGCVTKKMFWMRKLPKTEKTLSRASRSWSFRFTRWPNLKRSCRMIWKYLPSTYRKHKMSMVRVVPSRTFSTTRGEGKGWWLNFWEAEQKNSLIIDEVRVGSGLIISG